MFSEQTGLIRRTFWQRSFRSRVIESPRRFGIVVRYMHGNSEKARPVLHFGGVLMVERLNGERGGVDG